MFGLPFLSAPWSRLATVSDETNLFPPPTQDALDSRYDERFALPERLSSGALDTAFRRDVSVTEFGAGRGAPNDYAAISAALAAAIAGGVGLFVPALNYNLSGTFDLSSIPRPVRVTVEKGAVLTQFANAPIFKAWGAFGPWTMLTTNAAAGTRTCFVTSTSAYKVGDWIAISSSNTVPNSPDKIGYLRRITALTATQITFDTALPRGVFVAQQAHVQSARFVPRVEIVGGGQLRHVDSSNRVSLVELALVSGPVIGVEIGPSGGTGVTFAHCLGGGTTDDFYVHDLEDDGAADQYGYGINISGMTRDGVFRGEGERCRHVVTTNPGPNMPESNRYGEPENNYSRLATRDCSNKALDTHRVGWGNIFVPNHSGGSGGGVQVRADNTIVDGGNISGPNSVGISVAAGVTVPAQINNVNITSVAGANSPAIQLDGPAIVTSPYLYRFTGTGIRINAANCMVTNPVIDGVAAGSLRGIENNANNTIISGGRISNVNEGIKSVPGLIGTSITGVTYSNVTTPTS